MLLAISISLDHPAHESRRRRKAAFDLEAFECESVGITKLAVLKTVRPMRSHKQCTVALQRQVTGHRELMADVVRASGKENGIAGVARVERRLDRARGVIAVDVKIGDVDDREQPAGVERLHHAANARACRRPTPHPASQFLQNLPHAWALLRALERFWDRIRAFTVTAVFEANAENIMSTTRAS